MPDDLRLGPPGERGDLVQSLAADLGVSASAVEVAVSPYRVCPIGAHVDHQGGPVLGMAIDAQTRLAFAPRDDGRVRVRSENFEGRVELDLARPGSRPVGPEWGAYAYGAVRVFADLVPAARRGFSGRLSGALPGGGLSSSASVLLAYLAALARVNRSPLDARTLVRASRRVENEFVGVASGILDPASIVGARRGELLCIDTEAESWQSSPLGGAAAPPVVLVAFTGISRQLVHSGFNDRVGECHAAAEALLAAAGLEPPAGRRARLGDVDDAVFEAHARALAEPLALRARHFFSERRRVRAGFACWRAGDLASFGEHMKASCESSIHQYQTGSPELVDLQRILIETPGVLGARFSGAGFGGCAIALVESEAAPDAARRVHHEFVRAHPALAERARVGLVETDDGLRVESADGRAVERASDGDEAR